MGLLSGSIYNRRHLCKQLFALTLVLLLASLAVDRAEDATKAAPSQLVFL
jgi:hypothetical protein